MMHTATPLNSESQQFGLPDHLPFRNEDADLFSFLDGLGADQGNQGAGASRSARAAGLTALPSWTPPEQGGKIGPGLPNISLGASAAPDGQLSRLPLPDIPLGGLPLGDDSGFMHSLSSSTQLPYSYQQMPQHLQPPAAVMTSPEAGTPTQDVPSMPMWSQGNLAPMMHNDDLGGFVPVPPGMTPLLSPQIQLLTALACLLSINQCTMLLADSEGTALPVVRQGISSPVRQLICAASQSCVSSPPACHSW